MSNLRSCINRSQLQKNRSLLHFISPEQRKVAELGFQGILEVDSHNFETSSVDVHSLLLS
jgi:hypothetical protein